MELRQFELQLQTGCDHCCCPFSSKSELEDPFRVHQYVRSNSQRVPIESKLNHWKAGWATYWSPELIRSSNSSVLSCTGLLYAVNKLLTSFCWASNSLVDISLHTRYRIGDPILVRKRTPSSIQQHLDQENPTRSQEVIEFHISRTSSTAPHKIQVQKLQATEATRDLEDTCIRPASNN